MNIVSGLVFDPDDVSIEIILSLANIARRNKETIEADFKYHATSGKGTDLLELKASGRVRIHLGQPCHTIIPPRLASKLSDVLRPYCSSIRNVHSLLDFVSIDISSNTVVLSLTDLDTSIFKRLNSVGWGALKKIILLAGTLIWITQGRLADNPYANMMLGLIRGAARDNPTLDYLLLDTEDADRIDHCVIAETMLRYMAASQWWQRDNMKLTVENELVLDKAGRLLIPHIAGF